MYGAFLMEEFKEKARALTGKERKYPAKPADAWLRMGLQTHGLGT